MNIWDKLAPYFDTHKNPEEIPTGAADNILIAWPPILEVINSNIDNPKNMNVVDLGCGGGAFCKKLHELGFKVTGIDPSPKMIAVARQNCPKDIQFVIGNSSKLLELNSKYAAITSIMALPFEKELQNTASNILTVLNNNGIVVFAVFNPDFVASCLKSNVLFLGFEDQEHPSNGFIDLDGIKAPCFIRTAKEYDKVFLSLGLKKISEIYPPFTQEFLEKYPEDVPTKYPEFLILAYKKQNHTSEV